MDYHGPYLFCCHRVITVLPLQSPALALVDAASCVHHELTCPQLLAMWLRAVLAATLIDHTVLSTVADTLRCPLCKVDLAPLRSNCVPRLLASRALSLDDGQTLLHLPSALFRHLLRLP